MNSNSLKSSEVVETLCLRQITTFLICVWKLLRAWFFRWTLIITSCVFTTATIIRYEAEGNLLSIFLAYLPVWATALPLIITFMIGILVACWRSVAISALCALMIILWLGCYRFPRAMAPHLERQDETLTVMTYNRGQGSGKVLAKCANQCQPDIVVLQDAGRRLAQFAAMPEFAGYQHALQNGEYVILSRWPLLKNEALKLDWPEVESGVFHAGVRSVIDWNGHHLIIYNIHFPTPRDMLYWYVSSGSLMYGVLGFIPGTNFYYRHQQYLRYWSSRVGLASQLALHVGAERLPVILLGDLNFPPLGRAYCKFEELMQDAHKAAGNGFGFTFPNNFKSITRIAAPWMRLDHIFTSSHWKIRSCIIGSNENSEHLPVIASMNLKRLE